MFWFDFSWEIQHILNQFWWPINIGLLVVLLLIGYLSYKAPAYATGLTIILLPTYLFRSQIWFLPFTFLELCIWTLFIGFFFSPLNSKKIKFDKLFFASILLILAGATVALFISPNFKSAAGLWKAYIVEPIMFALVLKNVLQKKESWSVVLWSLGISTLIVSTLAIYQKFTGWGIFEPSWTGPNNRRVTSLFTSPNAVGLFLGPIITIYFGWLIAEIKNLQATILKTTILFLGIIAVIFTKSVGTWLALGLALIFLAFFGWNKKWTGLLVTLIIIISLALPISRDLLLPTIALEDASGQNRLILWKLAGENLTSGIKNFVFGLGILGFSEIQNSARDPLRIEPLLYPHNVLLNFWAELGLIGVVGFGLLIFRFFKQGLINPKNKWLKLGVMAAMITVLTHGLIDVPYFKNDLAVIFWIIISLI